MNDKKCRLEQNSDLRIEQNNNYARKMHKIQFHSSFMLGRILMGLIVSLIGFVILFKKWWHILNWLGIQNLNMRF